jgi:hypothetical protein
MEQVFRLGLVQNAICSKYVLTIRFSFQLKSITFKISFFSMF